LNYNQIILSEEYPKYGKKLIVCSMEYILYCWLAPQLTWFIMKITQLYKLKVKESSSEMIAILCW